MKDQNRLTDEYIGLAEVQKAVPAARSTLWRWGRQGTFPMPFKLGPRRVAWRRRDIEAWLASRTPVGGGESAAAAMAAEK